MKSIVFALALGASAIVSTAAQASCSMSGLSITCDGVDANTAADAAALAIANATQDDVTATWSHFEPLWSNYLYSGSVNLSMTMPTQPTLTISGLAGTGIEILEASIYRGIYAVLTAEVGGHIVSGYATITSISKVIYTQGGETHQLISPQTGATHYNINIPVPGPETGAGLAGLALLAAWRLGLIARNHAASAGIRT